MNEYIKLIDYLNARIEEVNNKMKSFQETSFKRREVINSLEMVIKQLDAHKLADINVILLNDILIDVLGIDEAGNLIEKFNDVLSMSEFLFDDSIVSPLKFGMLDDLQNIRNRIFEIKEKMLGMQINNPYIQENNELLTFLSVVNESGFCASLPAEFRDNFYSFLRNSNLELSDVLFIISNYIKYELSQKRNINIHMSYSSIDFVNSNADSIIRQLEENAREDKTRLEEDNSHFNLSESILTEEEKGVYNRILELLEEHNDLINSASYAIYKGIYENQDIITIFEQRSSFMHAGGIDWERAIPCIKEKLIPMINSGDKKVIFQIFNAVLALVEEETKQKDKDEYDKKDYRNKLDEFEKKFKMLRQEVAELKSKYETVLNFVDDMICEHGDNIRTLLNMVKTSRGEDVLISSLNYYGMTYEQGMVYNLLNEVIGNIDYINDFIEIGISYDDFNQICSLFEETKEHISVLIESYDQVSVGNISPGGDGEIANDGKKQYEYGNSVIIFFRKDNSSKFLIELDIENDLIESSYYNDICSILKKVSGMTSYDWDIAVTKSGNFTRPIYHTKSNGEMSDEIVKIKSDYSNKEYEFFRLKAGGKTHPRLSAFDIDMCEENRKKLNIPIDKKIIFVIGEKKVTKFNTETREYGFFKRELRDNLAEVQQVISLLENPNTSEDILYTLLNDSSDLYDSFVKKVKGLGD